LPTIAHKIGKEAINYAFTGKAHESYKSALEQCHINDDKITSRIYDIVQNLIKHHRSHCLTTTSIRHKTFITKLDTC